MKLENFINKLKQIYCKHNSGYLIESETVYCPYCKKQIGYVKPSGKIIINTTLEMI